MYSKTLRELKAVYVAIASTSQFRGPAVSLPVWEFYKKALLYLPELYSVPTYCPCQVLIVYLATGEE